MLLLYSIHPLVALFTRYLLRLVFLLPPSIFSHVYPAALTRHSTHLTEPMRERILHLVAQPGATQSGVARALMVAPNTIRNTIAHFHATGHTHDSHGGGREISYDDETWSDCGISSSNVAA
jgi:hypothetical protein